MPRRASSSGVRTRVRRSPTRQTSRARVAWISGKAGSDYRLFTVRNGYLYALDLRGQSRCRVWNGRSTEPRARGCSKLRLELRSDRRRRRRRHRGQSGWRRATAARSGRTVRRRTCAASTPARGKLLWTFHVVPHEGEFGADTWGNGSGKLSGDLGSWCCISADEAARLRLHSADGADRRVLRRIPAGRQPLLQRAGRARREDRKDASGTSRWFTTTCGSTTPSVRRPSATSRSTENGSRRSCSRARPASCMSSIA